MIMKKNDAFVGLGPLALAALAVLGACPGDDGPMGGTSETGTGTDTGPSPTSADSTDGTPMDACGNDVIDGSEQCDGSDLGGATCTDVNPAFEGGSLTCGSTCTFDASGCTVAPGTALVALNELTSDEVLSGRFAGPNDAIELHNAGSVAGDLSGWLISDDPTFPFERTYVFPSGTTIEPGEFLVLLTFDADTMTGVLPFGISNSQEETISLADGRGGVVDAVTVDGSYARISYCRVPDATGSWFQCEQTFGAANVASETVCGDGVREGNEQCDVDDLGGETCASLGIGFAGGVLGCKQSCRLDIDECTTDSLVVLNELSATTDDIEIFNAGPTDVDISGWVLTDDNVLNDYDLETDTAELVFPAGTVLGPGEYLVVAQGTGPGQHPFGLAAGGESVTLFELEPLRIVDRVVYDDGDAAVSWCRQPNGPGGVWQQCAVSMGMAN
jgi:hypothetical protein